MRSTLRLKSKEESMDIRDRLATLLPEKARPYAKAVYGLIIAVIGMFGLDIRCGH